MSRNAKSVIKAYLDEMAKKDESFAKKYANKEKSLGDCWAYIVSMAKKKGGQCVCLTDEEVFGLAVHYYVEGDLKDVAMPSDFKEANVPDEAEPKKVKATDERKVKATTAKKSKKAETEGMGYLFDF